MNYMKKIITILILSLSVFTTLSCSNSQEASGKIQIYASFYPLAHFAEKVGGDLAQVTNLMPVGVEPHQYEPSIKAISKIRKADLFIYNGAGLDNWAEKVISKLKIRLSDHIDLIKVSGSVDPHFWIDPVNAIKEVEIIKDALIKIDPKNKTIYEKNAEKYIKELKALHAEYKNSLSTCKFKTIVVSHDAFRYLAARYGFETVAIRGLSTEEEPSPKKIAEIANLAKKSGVKYIFTETLISPKLAETIASEIGVKTLVLNPVHGLTNKEVLKGEDYISIMKENLVNLSLALGCK